MTEGRRGFGRGAELRSAYLALFPLLEYAVSGLLRLVTLSAKKANLEIATRTSPAGRGGRRRQRAHSEERWRDPERSLAAARPEAIPCRVIVSNGVARGNDRTLSYRFQVAAHVDSVAPSYLRKDFGVCRVLRHNASTPKSTARCGMESKIR